MSPKYVALNGAEDIDGSDLEEQFAAEDANRKAAGNDGLEFEENVFNYQRLCDPNAPFFLDDRSGDGGAATTGRRAKTQKEPRVAEGHRETKAADEQMRLTARRNVEKKVGREKQHYDKMWSQARAQVERGVQILVRVGQFTQRMRGRLECKYAGPFAVAAVDGWAIKKKKEGKGEATTLRAGIDDVEIFNQRGGW